MAVRDPAPVGGCPERGPGHWLLRTSCLAPARGPSALALVPGQASATLRAPTVAAPWGRAGAMAAPGTIFDLAAQARAPVLDRVFAFHLAAARCTAGPALQAKYGLRRDDCQSVLSVTDRLSGQQAWYNGARANKPQTFKPEPPAPDPTNGGRDCDFCRWSTHTGEDAWGRVELPHAVTASNLFKYCAPCHGLVLFKHHNPLNFSEAALNDLLSAAATWFQCAATAHPSANHPLLIWNSGPRAGASQYHGHAQVALSAVPFPAAAALHSAADRYSALFPGADYYADLCRAHEAAGLLRSLERVEDRASCFASITPTQDKELVINGSHLAGPAFQAMLFSALRTLIDELGVTTFNVGILNISAARSTKNQTFATDTERFQSNHPLVARIVSRGRLSSPASDFGGLEVIGGASIGKTDPYLVISKLDRQLSRLPAMSAEA